MGAADAFWSFSIKVGVGYALVGFAKIYTNFGWVKMLLASNLYRYFF